MKTILLVGFFTLVLSACSPQQLFEQLAKSDIEQAASESVNQSNQIIDTFETLVTAKKAEFKVFAKLVSQIGDTSYGYMFQNGAAEKVNTTEVHAMLPDLENETDYYQAWFVDGKSGKTVSLGRMVFNKESNSRSAVFNSPTQLTPFQRVFVAIQSNTSNVPGELILEYRNED
ncbi:hypothetical protein A3B57_00340 [Microgenomates group bacterium RIFCSPLOWO2_01_FULL_47_10]|nr:MAG: hypothetical protein A3B57_00340 [Microgenomates group bacterium RIFCSPLOWO2_01_FULL_47_10]